MIELTPLPPKDAIAYFRSKGLAPPDRRFDYRDIWRSEHAQNFVVAKAMRTEVLELIRSQLDRTLSEGGTLAGFTEALEPELKRLGWWGRATERDPLTGEMKSVQLGSPRRLRIIFDANLRAAHAAGKWARIERVKDAFPFLRYVQVQRDSKREDHVRYHDLIRPVDDPVWDRIYPPNGWRCGCTIQQLSQAMMDRRGLSVTEEFTLGERGVLNKRTGEIEPTALGVDPAWDGNPGKAWLDLRNRHAGMAADMPEAAAATERGFAERARLFGISDGREHLGAFDVTTGEEIDWRSGKPDRVTLGSAIAQRLRAGQEIGLVHNHPTSAPFSPDDFKTMFKDNIASVVAVGHDGSLYKARLLRSTSGNMEELTGAIRDLTDEMEPALTRVERDHAIRMAMVHVLRSLGLILYQEDLGAQTLAVRNRVDDLSRGIAAAILQSITGERQ